MWTKISQICILERKKSLDIFQHHNSYIHTYIYMCNIAFNRKNNFISFIFRLFSHSLLSCNEQGDLNPDQVAQSPVPPHLQCFQGQGLHHLSGQSVQCFTTLLIKNFFLISNLDLPPFILKQLPLVLLLPPSFFKAPFKYWKALNGIKGQEKRFQYDLLLVRDLNKALKDTFLFFHCCVNIYT